MLDGIEIMLKRVGILVIVLLLVASHFSGFTRSAVAETAGMESKVAAERDHYEIYPLPIAEFDHILNAIDVFREESQNEAMLEEIEPWLNSLHDVVQSDKNAAKAAMSLQSGDMNSAWEALAIATSAMAESKTFTKPVINNQEQVVEAGAKRLVPFANELIQKLDAKIYTAIDPAAVIPTAITSYGSHPDLNNMIDDDEDTFTYIQTIQENGDWYGLDLGKTIKVEEIDILQG